jgi:hypothetical protein
LDETPACRSSSFSVTVSLSYHRHPYLCFPFRSRFPRYNTQQIHPEKLGASRGERIRDLQWGKDHEDRSEEEEEEEGGQEEED